ncbi:MAG: peptide-binding protein [Thiotrichales bacterium]
MENRFTAKDFFIFLVLFGLIAALLLTMYMIDRQWRKLDQIAQVMREQADDVRRLRLGLNSGAFSSAATAAADGAVPEAFRRSQKVTLRPDYAEGDWLVQPFGTSLKTITPLVSSDAYASDVQNYVLESLLTRDPETLEWQGFIAERWQVSDDGLRFTFTLRPGVVFSDGAPLTADDVAFTFSFIMDERIEAPRQRAYFEKIDSVKAIDASTVEFVFKEPYYDSLSLAGGMDILARHFYEPYFEDPQKFNQSKGLLFGSGPYRLADPRTWTPDQGIVELERNQRYWAPVQPNFERVLWKIIENETARLTTYRNRDIDVYSAKPLEYQDLRQDAGLMSRSQALEYASPTAGYSYIGWNQERNGQPSRFADKRVRKAMTYLTDKQRIVAEIMLGYGEPAVGPFSPQSKQRAPDLTVEPFDVAAAKALLSEVGYEDRNNDGLLEDASGQPFRFELVYFQDNEDTKRIVLFLKDLYARAGIELVPKPAEWSVMLDLLKKKDFDAITLGWTGGVESDLYQIFHSSQTKTNGDNFISYANPELDKLIEQARGTVDEERRMPLWHAAERILYEDQPYTWLMRRKSLIFIDTRMQNVEVTRLGLNLGDKPVSWYVPAEMQKY